MTMTAPVTMTPAEQIITVAMCVLATMLSRFLPFIIFRADKPVPKYVDYLGRVLPAAVFGMLVVYSLRGTDILGGSHGLPELIAMAVVVLSYLWRRNMLLSIAGGTAAYMLLIHFVFV